MAEACLTLYENTFELLWFEGLRRRGPGSRESVALLRVWVPTTSTFEDTG
jgi:hypothetical protein